jgi:hypothetical protein
MVGNSKPNGAASWTINTNVTRTIHLNPLYIPASLSRFLEEVTDQKDRRFQKFTQMVDVFESTESAL